MEEFFQFSVFNAEKQPFKINKKVRLIELFAGYGSQHICVPVLYYIFKQMF